jgi:DNA-directed RNA polymerase subunit RPC12/RpoP
LKFKVISFKCKGCGGPLRFNPTTNSLKCDFCGGVEKIELKEGRVEAYPLESGLRLIDNKRINSREVKCIRCGASFSLDYDMVSSNCPYCTTPAITEFVKPIKPNSLIPFAITPKEAQSRFKSWVGSLWFAPTRLKEFVDGNKKLTALYLPYWAFNANAYTRYRGERGDIYFVTVQRRVIVNGREQIVYEQEPRIRWTPVSGEVSNSFRDLEVSATKRLPVGLLESLSPWNVKNLIPFDVKYLLGFVSREYTIELRDGFMRAKLIMERVIDRTIRRDIGGDQQQIHYRDINYSDEEYKNVLFPVYTADFKWKGEDYIYLINGQSGKVVGERPYSILKITLLVIVIVTILAIAIYIDSHR